jgi:hypothetical protein
MKFGIHNPSWLFGTDPVSDPGGIFDAVKAKALWAELPLDLTASSRSL